MPYSAESGCVSISRPEKFVEGDGSDSCVSAGSVVYLFADYGRKIFRVNLFQKLKYQAMGTSI